MTVKSYYLKQSHYLSGITEQSIEESDFATSVENPNAKFGESNAQEKRLAISKITVNSETEPKRDSMAFLYDKFKEHFDQQSDGSDNDNFPISMSPFKIVDEAQQNSSKEEKSEPSAQKPSNKASHTNLLNPLDSQTQQNGEENGQNCEEKYRNFRQGSKGVLTIDEL